MATDRSRSLRRAALVVALATAVSTPACVAGLAYHHVTEPVDTNFDATPAKPGDRGGSHKRLVIPWPLRAQFDWGSTAVAQAMAEAGMEKAYYADLETRSFLGVWTQRWLHIYGE